MNVRNVVFCLIFLVIGIQSKAQDIIDTSILLSQSNFGGSARMQGVGGAQVSLGGDISNIVSNPAGLGMFNRSVASFSYGTNFVHTTSDYFNTTISDQKVNLNIPNMSIVLHKEFNSNYSNFKNGSFGISYARINDFHQQATYQGRSESSMIDFFLDNAQGVFIEDFEDLDSFDYNSLEGLATRTFLIFPTSDIDTTNGFDDEYVSDIFGEPLQTETISTKGSLYQLSFSYGANYNDILFIGGGIGLTSVNYSSHKTYYENDFIYENTDDPDYVNPLNKYTLEENMSISGHGVNVTLGIMFRPVDFIQVGGSLSTPTYYNLEDEYDARINVDYNNFDDESAETEIVSSNYSLTTPLKVSGGVTVFIGNHGFITADVEMLNYGNNNLKSDDYLTLSDNQYITATYNKSYNVKIGGEFRHDIFRFRGGYGHYDDPSSIKTNNKQLITGGVGVGVKKYFLDLSIISTVFKSEYHPYQLENISPRASIRNNNTKVVISFGVNF